MASTSGDPHIFPLHGNMYELPQSKGIYRLLQGDDLIINASTRQIRENEKNSIVSFFNQKNLLTHETKDKLVNDGVFYHKLFISSEGCGFIYDFDNKKVYLNNRASKKYFNFTTHNVSGGVYENKYEKSDNVAQCCVSFQHTLYGSMTIDLNYFSNPQIKYGIGMKLPNNTQDLTGLLIREYITSSMKVSCLCDESEKEGIVGENDKITSMVIS